MRHSLWRCWVFLLPLPFVGCAARSEWERPPAMEVLTRENPLFVPQIQDGRQYQNVFDTVYDVMHEYFDISSSNLYSGQIIASPFISAGVYDWIRLGGYDAYELWESTTQSIIRKPLASITPAECGGYFVEIQIWKELENRYQAPVQSFGTLFGTQRNSKGIGENRAQGIPMGRDSSLEQAIINKLKQRL